MPLRRSGVTLGVPRGFNEAEARAPRMQGFTRAESAAIVGRFNEAEARAPRMLGLVATPLERGNQRFNEAEARAPRMPDDLQARAARAERLQ